MAIATGTAIALGASALAAGSSIYGASKAAKAQNKAADQAADTAAYTANLNNQLARDMYGANAARLDPFAANGLHASNALTDMLLGTSSFNPNVNPYKGTLADPTNPASPAAAAGRPPYTEAQIAAMWNDGVPGNAEAAQNANNQWYASHPQGATPNALAPVAAAPPVAAPTAPTAPPVAPTAAANALAPVAGSGTVEQQAQQAIAAGANPSDVRARMDQVWGSMPGQPVGLGGR